ncbi:MULTISPECIES: DNA methyltransferase [unclassified Methylobacterium]|uniref:DNA methyltransferase n=1 Tax=unclassified Methylobacterium TaxID=2615210 RepID=UPI003703224E
MNLPSESLAAALGQELRSARRSRKVTQKTLAASARLDLATVQNLEAGRGTVASMRAVLAVLRHRFIAQSNKQDVGEWLVANRKDAGLSQQRLAALSRCSKPTIIKIERGQGHINSLVAVLSVLKLASTLRSDEHSEEAASGPPQSTPTIRVIQGDCREIMRGLAAECMQFDACVTDPPYHLSIAKRFGRKNSAPIKGGEPGSANPYRAMANGFMGQDWDGGGVAFDADTWRAVYNVLKPGGYLVAFGGTRTFHRLVVAVEDAGFEIRDMISWVFGTGFPKSTSVGRGIQRLRQGSAHYSGRTMPSAEGSAVPGSLLREMATGEWTGRTVEIADPDARRWEGFGTALKPAYEPIIIARKPLSEKSVAANVLKHGTGALNIDGCRVAVADGTERWPANIIHDGSDAVISSFSSPATEATTRGQRRPTRQPHPTPSSGMDAMSAPNDAINPARFFYCAKASASDRGCGNHHPTVKPNNLMRYLVRLVTPPGGTVLDPFLGSGSTGKAALEEGFGILGCELMPEYIQIACSRIGAGRTD